MATPGRALPQPTPETQHFWDGAKASELLLQRCDDCSKVYFPPRPFCPVCASRKVSVTQGERQGDALQLRHPSPPGARLHAALCDRGRATGRRPAHDDQHRRMPADARGAAYSTCRWRWCSSRRPTRSPCPSSVRRKADTMPHNTVAVVGAAETTDLGVITEPVADRPARRCRAERDGRLRAEAEGYRRHRLRQRNAGAACPLPRHHADLGRWHRGRRLLAS